PRHDRRKSPALLRRRGLTNIAASTARDAPITGRSSSVLKTLNHKLTMLCAAAGIVLGASAAHAADKLTFVRSSPWGLDSAQLTFGEQLGFFAEEGIEVEYVVAQGSLAAVQQVLGGSGEVTYLSPEVIALSHQEGKTPLPMLLVYNYYRRFIWEVVVLE